MRLPRVLIRTALGVGLFGILLSGCTPNDTPAPISSDTSLYTSIDPAPTAQPPLPTTPAPAMPATSYVPSTDAPISAELLNVIYHGDRDFPNGYRETYHDASNADIEYRTYVFHSHAGGKTIDITVAFINDNIRDNMRARGRAFDLTITTPGHDDKLAYVDVTGSLHVRVTAERELMILSLFPENTTNGTLNKADLWLVQALIIALS